MSKRTAKEYKSRLSSFRAFVSNYYDNQITIDDLLVQIKEGLENPYNILNNYATFLIRVNNISSSTLKQRVVTIKNFLEFHDVEISPRKFKMKVKLPKVIKKKKEALTKKDVTNILNNCSDIRSKTYVMLLAATGMRAVEALSIRNKDLYLQSNSSSLFVRGEFTKTKSDRTVNLTLELRDQLISWLDYKYRSRRVCYSDGDQKTITEYRTPEKHETDLIFSVYQSWCILITSSSFSYLLSTCI